MDKVVFLTGVSGSLGSQLCVQLIEGGYKVYGVSRSQNNWDYIKNRVNNSDLLVLSQLDVTEEVEVKYLVAEIIEKESKIDVLINNAACVHDLVRFEDTSDDVYHQNFNVNVRGVFNTCKHVIPHMIKLSESTIVNMSSMAGVRSVPKLGIYSATKFAVSGMSQAIAKENYQYKLKCITVSPGGMNTPLRVQAFGEEDAKKQQSPEVVANIIFKIINHEIPVDSGSDVTVRFEKIIGITKSPDY